MSLDAATAEALRAMGHGFCLPEVQALYAPRWAAQPRDGVRATTDLAYGPDERHRLDVYRPTTPGPHPVLAWWHGGGFLRGDRTQRAHLGWWGARAGFVTVLPSYRLAPRHRWPSGPEDVVAVWRWLRAEVAGHGGDPARLVLGGDSAGAAHVAAATLMRRFQPAGWHVAGTVLLSGPYNAHLEGLARAPLAIPTPDPRNEAYFGPDAAGWAAASITPQVDARPPRLLIAWAQRDLVQMQVQGAELFARLAQQTVLPGGDVPRQAPQLLVVPEHNHFSAIASVGTGDDSLAGPLAAFVQAC